MGVIPKASVGSDYGASACTTRRPAVGEASLPWGSAPLAQAIPCVMNTYCSTEAFENLSPLGDRASGNRTLLRLDIRDWRLPPRVGTLDKSVEPRRGNGAKLWIKLFKDRK